jgi:hypothetical protein
MNIKEIYDTLKNDISKWDEIKNEYKKNNNVLGEQLEHKIIKLNKSDIFEFDKQIYKQHNMTNMIKDGFLFKLKNKYFEKYGDHILILEKIGNGGLLNIKKLNIVIEIIALNLIEDDKIETDKSLYYYFQNIDAAIDNYDDYDEKINLNEKILPDSYYINEYENHDFSNLNISHNDFYIGTYYLQLEKIVELTLKNTGITDDMIYLLKGCNFNEMKLLDISENYSLTRKVFNILDEINFNSRQNLHFNCSMISIENNDLFNLLKTKWSNNIAKLSCILFNEPYLYNVEFYRLLGFKKKRVDYPKDFLFKNFSEFKNLKSIVIAGPKNFYMNELLNERTIEITQIMRK